MACQHVINHCEHFSNISKTSRFNPLTVIVENPDSQILAQHFLTITRDYFDATASNWNTSAHRASWRVSLYKDRQSNRRVGAIFFGKGGAPKISKPVLGTSFQGLLPEKFWTTPPDPKGLGKNFDPQFYFFLGGGPPQGVHKLYIMTHYNL